MKQKMTFFYFTQVIFDPLDRRRLGQPYATDAIEQSIHQLWREAMPRATDEDHDTERSDL